MGSALVRNLIGFLVFSVLTAATPGLRAEIATDGTLGPAITLAGPDYAVTADLGYSSGSTLFHSFQVFDLYSGESTVFSGPESVDTIISRVTGGRASFIDGSISSDIRPVNFYFLNPSGIMLGPDAALDISGAVHLSTADYLILNQKGRMDASLPDNSLLTSAPVEAFGFLDEPAPISLEECRLNFQDHQIFSLIGGDISLKGALVGAPSGRMDLAALNTAGEVRLDTTGIALDNPENRGNLTLSEGSVLRGFSASDSALCNADIYIRGGDILIQGGENRSGIFATVENGTAGGGGRISIDADGLTLMDNAFINADTTAVSQGGSIAITADHILLDGQGHRALIQADVGSDSQAQGGNIRILTKNGLDILNGGGISTSTYGDGNAGNIEIRAESIRIDNQGNPNGTGMAAGVSENASGNGGSITISADRDIVILNGGSILVSSWSQGNGGRLHIQSEDLTIDGKGSLTGLAAQIGPEAVGCGGDILVELTGSLEMRDGARISTNTLGIGDSGGMGIYAKNILVQGSVNASSGFVSGVGNGASGNGGDIDLYVAENLELIDNAYIYATTLGRGRAGSVNVSTGNLLLDGGGYDALIQADVGSESEGKGGDIRIQAEGALTIVDGGGITASTYGGGDAGNIGITALRNLHIADGGFIMVSNWGPGEGGRLHIQSEDMTIDGKGYATGLAAEVGPSATGRGGDVLVELTGALEMTDGGRISTNTYGKGDSGDMSIFARNIRVQGSSYMPSGFASAVVTGATGHGGDIRIHASEDLELMNNAAILASSLGDGNAGNLDIQAANIHLDGQGNLARIDAEVYSESAEVQGGYIHIQAEGTLELLNGGVVSSQTFGPGNAGDIDIKAGHVHIDNQNNPNGTGITAGVNENSAGIGGNIAVDVYGRLEIINGGSIQSSTWGQGSSGDIDIRSGDILIDGQGVPTGIAAEAGPDSSGNGGTVRVQSPGTLTLTDNGQITSSSYSTGWAGDIVLSSPRILLDKASGILSEAVMADGGNIDIFCRDYLRLADSAVTTSVAGGQGSGGNITIDPVFIILDNGRIIANAYEGTGGNIHMIADYYFPDADSVVQASSELGIDGSVTIEAPETDLGAGLAVLPGYRSPPELTLNPCDTKADDSNSTLIKTGVDLSSDPEKPLTSDWIVGNEP